jgi:NAD(P)-dependent dehydrogenase (short-subunit alcohol dehydrogenase family)
MFDKRRYSRWPAYFQSKLANLLFTLELHRRGAKALTAHPGASRTDLGHEGTGWTNVVMKPMQRVMTQSAAMGCLPLVRAAVDPNAQSGEFYGPAFLYAGPPRKETPSKRARNAADARALWEKSEELTGTTFAL